MDFAPQYTDDASDASKTPPGVDRRGKSSRQRSREEKSAGTNYLSRPSTGVNSLNLTPLVKQCTTVETAHMQAEVAHRVTNVTVLACIP